MVDVTFSTSLAVLLAVSVGTLLLIDYKQPDPYLDEIFHIPQAKKYCDYKFEEWDPKITTLPGMYVVSFILLQTVAFTSRIRLTVACSVFWLRCTNILFAIGNAWLLRKVLMKIHFREKGKRVQPHSEDQSQDKMARTKEEVLRIRCMITALTLSIFPVLYFFTFLYYTDAGSTFFVLLMYSLSLSDHHILASACGFAAIMFRQTNAIWVIFTAGTTALRHLQPSVTEKSGQSSGFLQELLQYIMSFIEHFVEMVRVLWAYGFLVAAFLVFVIMNGGIVVGDKSSHEACMNFPQVFYFLGFILLFSAPLFLLPDDLIEFLKTLKVICSKPLKLLIMVLSLLLMIGLVYKFTYVHEYLLADNRHYPFYVWHKFYARHWLARYLAIPVYFYSAWGMVLLLSKKQSNTWLLVFWICVMLVTVPQKLLEFRYYILPYILFRVHCPLVSYVRLALEFSVYFIINVATVYLFLEKTFVWPHDPTQLQRFMW